MWPLNCGPGPAGEHHIEDRYTCRWQQNHRPRELGYGKEEAGGGSTPLASPVSDSVAQKEARTAVLGRCQSQ